MDEYRQQAENFLKKTLTKFEVEFLKHDKYFPESFENFCDCYGYDTDSRKAEKVYNAVKEEYLNLTTLFNDDEMELLREIQ